MHDLLVLILIVLILTFQPHSQHAFQIDALILKSLLTKYLPGVKTWMDVSRRAWYSIPAHVQQG